jgi:hypothetical protein
MYLKETTLPLFSTLYIGTVGSSKELHPSNKQHDTTLHEAVINLHRHRHENLKPQVQLIIIEIMFWCHFKTGGRQPMLVTSSGHIKKGKTVKSL